MPAADLTVRFPSAEPNPQGNYNCDNLFHNQMNAFHVKRAADQSTFLCCILLIALICRFTGLLITWIVISVVMYGSSYSKFLIL